jgi:hypothetical protein
MPRRPRHAIRDGVITGPFAIGPARVRSRQADAFRDYPGLTDTKRGADASIEDGVIAPFCYWLIRMRSCSADVLRRGRAETLPVPRGAASSDNSWRDLTFRHWSIRIGCAGKTQVPVSDVRSL